MLEEITVNAEAMESLKMIVAQIHGPIDFGVKALTGPSRTWRVLVPVVDGQILTDTEGRVISAEYEIPSNRRS